MRPKDHDNIPSLPGADPFSGHIIKCLNNYDLWMEVLHSLWLRKPLPVIAFKSWFQWYSIILMDPNIIKFVFETKFEKFKKGDGVRVVFHELLGGGIFMSDPPQWKFHRKVAARMFSMRNLKDHMFNCGVLHSKAVIHKLSTLQSVDIYDIFARFTLDCFTDIAFGKSVDSLHDDQCAFGNAFDAVVSQMSIRMIAPQWYWRACKYLNIREEKKIKHNMQVINEFSDRVLDERQKVISNITDEEGGKYNDILSLFMKHNKELSRKQLRDIALNMIIAGRDTTRLLCSWFIYEMSLYSNRVIKNKVYAEIDALIHSNHKDYEARYDDICNKLQYLEACLLETLRLHPVVPWLLRFAEEDVKLPPILVHGMQKEYIIRKGNQVAIPTFSYGRHPDLWNDPLLFDPMRFYDENNRYKGVAKYSTYKYPFFNVQPRLCLGRKLAITEAKTMLFYMLKNFDFSLEPNQEIKVQSGPVLNMKYGLWIKLKDRNKCNAMEAKENNAEIHSKQQQLAFIYQHSQENAQYAAQLMEKELEMIEKEQILLQKEQILEQQKVLQGYIYNGPSKEESPESSISDLEA